ncbi:hypothetical protein D9M71_410470 [compost metagenome]
MLYDPCLVGQAKGTQPRCYLWRKIARGVEEGLMNAAVEDLAFEVANCVDGLERLGKMGASLVAHHGQLRD